MLKLSSASIKDNQNSLRVIIIIFQGHDKSKEQVNSLTTKGN